VRMFPDYLPYANVFWGGPAKTNQYFTDSAVDWGQQLKETKQWVDGHNVKECWFAYFAAPFLLPSDYGIPCKPLPTLDTMYEEDLSVPPVVHGPVLISYGSLNGYEFGSKIRTPYERLFERKPDDVIANGIAVFYGDFTLPEAAAIEFEHRSVIKLKKDPAAALREAQQAVALVPEGFDANVALGDAQAALGDWPAARAAYAVALSRMDQMEPTVQERWRPVLKEKMAAVSGKTN
jgi:hypothetical protein